MPLLEQAVTTFTVTVAVANSGTAIVGKTSKPEYLKPGSLFDESNFVKGAPTDQGYYNCIVLALLRIIDNKVVREYMVLNKQEVA